MGLFDGQCPKGKLRTDLYPYKYGNQFSMFFLDKVLPKAGLTADQFMGGIGDKTLSEYDSEPGDPAQIRYMVHLINDDDRTKNLFSRDKKLIAEGKAFDIDAPLRTGISGCDLFTETYILFYHIRAEYWARKNYERAQKTADEIINNILPKEGIDIKDIVGEVPPGMTKKNYVNPKIFPISSKGHDIVRTLYRKYPYILFGKKDSEIDDGPEGEGSGEFYRGVIIKKMRSPYYDLVKQQELLNHIQPPQTNAGTGYNDGTYQTTITDAGNDALTRIDEADTKVLPFGKHEGTLDKYKGHKL